MASIWKKGRHSRHHKLRIKYLLPIFSYIYPFNAVGILLQLCHVQLDNKLLTIVKKHLVNTRLSITIPLGSTLIYGNHTRIRFIKIRP